MQLQPLLWLKQKFLPRLVDLNSELVIFQCLHQCYLYPSCLYLYLKKYQFPSLLHSETVVSDTAYVLSLLFRTLSHEMTLFTTYIASPSLSSTLSKMLSPTSLTRWLYLHIRTSANSWIWSTVIRSPSLNFQKNLL